MAKKIKRVVERRSDRNECIILASKELKNTLMQRCKDLGISIEEVIVHHGDDVETFKNKYLNMRAPKSSAYLSQKQLLTYLDFVGIKFNVLVVKDHASTIEKTEENIRILKDKRRARSLRYKYGSNN